MTTKYIAKLDGIIVGKRTTKDRTYTHAIVALSDEAGARDAAYNHVADEDDRDNYEFDCREVVAAKVYGTADPDAYRARCAAKVEGGFEAYVARVRTEKIERFEHDLSNGKYKPGVVAWAGRADLAQKEAAKWAKWRKQVWIVPAEVV